MRLNLLVWRQPNATSPGKMVPYTLEDISAEMSFLEMLDVLNESLIRRGEEPVAFDSDCREGICGSCGIVIDGRAHGPLPNTTACQLHLRVYHDGDTITIEPWRARAFPIVKDLSVDRSALDRVVAAGGFISVNVGGAPQANGLPIPKHLAEAAMDAAACIQCGACVAQCKNASAALFTGAKISHLALLPQGEAERVSRARAMVRQMDLEGFGSCSNEGECEAVCPKGIRISSIARMNREFIGASLSGWAS
ncbi:MAG: succinate dehydrogenase/fumarate reductase iron-sulfur subunit [Chloroflexota bacterium]|nr:MAG: succinate dehydrogenase/fumarate reductase iron-sulfur subunit [Chloroflexota bacterium]